jgi:glycosyltransferase involved in cell wall biosynthesis
VTLTIDRSASLVSRNRLRRAADPPEASVKIRYVVLNAYGYGGTTRTVVNQANELCRDHDVEIASVYRHRDDPCFTIDPRIRLVPLTGLRSDGAYRTDPLGTCSRLMRKTRRFRNRMPHRHDHQFPRWDPGVDVAVLRYMWAARDGILVTTRPGLNLLSATMAPRRLIRVGQDHMNLAAYKPALRSDIIEHYPKLDALTVLTEQDAAAYRQALGGSGLRMQRIGNGIPHPRLPPAALDAKVLVAAGRLEQQKGFDLLLDAFATVHAEHPDWHLWIFGSGKGRAALQAQITRLGLTGRAHLKGQTDHLDERLAEASVFVLSSRFEGLPMALLEAMAAGLPAVAFDCPTGPADVVEHGRSGLLVPAQDVGALADGIRELITAPEVRRAMGARARELSAQHTITETAGRWRELFAELEARRTAIATRPGRLFARGRQPLSR